MGQLADKTSSGKMPKSSSSGKKSGPVLTPKPTNFCDPKVQGVLLVGLLAVLALALWFGLSNGCLGGARRRRRRQTCC